MSWRHAEFRRPPEAPVFRPSAEEFQDPIAYIESIRRKVGDVSGICKVIPPSNWKPPFAVDFDQFRFTPRIQKLNELEAQSRVKLNFVDHLTKFWELQGKPLRLPWVEQKYLDLFKLQRVVRDEGGFETVTKERRWGNVVRKMGYPSKKLSFTLRNHYERLLYPYDIFLSGATCSHDVASQPANPYGLSGKNEEMACVKEELVEQKVETKVKVKETKTEPTYQTRRSVKLKPEPVVVEATTGVQTRRSANHSSVAVSLADHGSAISLTNRVVPLRSLHQNQSSEIMEQSTPLINNREPLAKEDAYYCRACGRGDDDRLMLLCDGIDCDEAYHTYCLIPPLADIPPGDWRCPDCLALECKQSSEAYGFEQSQKEYTLKSFGKMADQFKREYFGKPLSSIGTEAVEREFWNLVNNHEKSISVLYGADIHASDSGSGFPTEKTKDQFTDAKEYIESAWNLNNLPILSASVLQYISVDIPGMKVPWCYVGMCFSSFAWHIEDHWSYSVNYLHWGEPKTWYGVPEVSAVKLEECMKHVAPELFAQSPDLLHQLTTILNPNVIMDYGVPIHRTDQCAGEFVVTFPRAYHAGFNQGFNFAEAVNFCPTDWLPLGRQCIDSYRQVHRQCVFSHDELLCEMCKRAETLDIDLARAIYTDLVSIIDRELCQRDKLAGQGLTKRAVHVFEKLDDDERQCDCCKTTLYLSGVVCSSTSNKVVCLDHLDQLCACSNHREHTLRYRYDRTEMKSMLVQLKKRCKALDVWTHCVSTMLNAPADHKPHLSELKELLTKARETKLPETESLRQLSIAVQEADECIAIVTRLTTKKVRTRHGETIARSMGSKMSCTELKEFCARVDSLHCQISDTSLKELLKRVEKFALDSNHLVSSTLPANLNKLEELVNSELCLLIDFPQYDRLKEMLVDGRWVEETKSLLADRSSLTMSDLRYRKDSAPKRRSHDAACRTALAELQTLITDCERLEQRAKDYLIASVKPDIVDVEKLLDESYELAVHLDSVDSLHAITKKANDWMTKVNALLVREHKPHLGELESLLNKGQLIGVHMNLFDQLTMTVDSARTWMKQFALAITNQHALVNQVVSAAEKSHKWTSPNLDDTDSCKLTDLMSSVEEELRVKLNSKRLRHENKLSVDSGNKISTNLHGGDMEKLLTCCICYKSTEDNDAQRCFLCWKACHDNCRTSTDKKSTTDFSSSCLLCPTCRKKTRLTLPVIQSLVRSWHGLGLCLPQGRALVEFFDRLQRWRERTKTAFTRSDVSAAIASVAVKPHEDLLCQENGSEVGCLAAGCGSDDGSMTASMLFEHGYSAPSPASSPDKCMERLSADGFHEVEELFLTAFIFQVDLSEVESLAQALHVHQQSLQAAERLRIERNYAVPAAVVDVNCRKTKSSRKAMIIPRADPMDSCDDMLSRYEDSINQVVSRFTGRGKRGRGRGGVQTSNLDQIIAAVASGLETSNEKRRKRKVDLNAVAASSKLFKTSVVDELCAAGVCLKPKCQKVDWVQCDKCELWFHLYCLGLHLNPEQVKNMDYVCTTCELATITKLKQQKQQLKPQKQKPRQQLQDRRKHQLQRAKPVLRHDATGKIYHAVHSPATVAVDSIPPAAVPQFVSSTSSPAPTPCSMLAAAHNLTGTSPVVTSNLTAASINVLNSNAARNIAALANGSSGFPTSTSLFILAAAAAASRPANSASSAPASAMAAVSSNLLAATRCSASSVQELVAAIRPVLTASTCVPFQKSSSSGHGQHLAPSLSAVSDLTTAAVCCQSTINQLLALSRSEQSKPALNYTTTMTAGGAGLTTEGPLRPMPHLIPLGQWCRLGPAGCDTPGVIDYSCKSPTTAAPEAIDYSFKSVNKS